MGAQGRGWCDRHHGRTTTLQCWSDLRLPAYYDRRRNVAPRPGRASPGPTTSSRRLSSFQLPTLLDDPWPVLINLAGPLTARLAGGLTPRTRPGSTTNPGRCVYNGQEPRPRGLVQEADWSSFAAGFPARTPGCRWSAWSGRRARRPRLRRDRAPPPRARHPRTCRAPSRLQHRAPSRTGADGWARPPCPLPGHHPRAVRDGAAPSARRHRTGVVATATVVMVETPSQTRTPTSRAAGLPDVVWVSGGPSQGATSTARRDVAPLCAARPPRLRPARIAESLAPARRGPLQTSSRRPRGHACSPGLD